MIKFQTKFNNILKNIYIISIVFAIFLLIIQPETAIFNFSQGILMWATKVLPALLPFFILTKLLSYTQFTEGLGRFLSPITQKIYGVGGVSGYIYIMSIISGYPIGAKLTSDFYSNGILTERQAHTITAFTSTSGPLFIIGTVGIGFFHSQLIGIIALLAHFIGALLNGLLYRCRRTIAKQSNTRIFPSNPLNESMSTSISSIMIVGGFIAIFYMFLSLLLSINAFNLPIWLLSKVGISQAISKAMIAGIIEVTTGASMLSSALLSWKTNTILLSFLISFGGLSIHAQAFCFLKNFNMKYLKFLLQKTTHALISASVAFVIVIFI